MLILPLLWLVSLAVRDAINGNSISILNQYFWTSVFAQKKPTLAALGAMIAAISVALFSIYERRKHRRMTSLAYSQAAIDFDSKPRNAVFASSTSENVSMQYGQIITPVPIDAAVHYTTLKSIGGAWILLTLGGVILSLVLNPTKFGSEPDTAHPAGVPISGIDARDLDHVVAEDQDLLQLYHCVGGPC